MKCPVCGYEQGFDWVEREDGSSDFEEVNPTGEKFILFQGNFFAKEEGNCFDDVYEVEVYACPKCRTLRISD